MQEEPTPVTGSQLEGAARVIARSDEAIARSERLRAQALERALDEAEILELVARLAKVELECKDLRARIYEAIVRLERVEGRVTAVEETTGRIEGAVGAISTQVARLNVAAAKATGFTILGGAIANAVMHKLGWL
jgi:hypothetical protein